MATIHPPAGWLPSRALQDDGAAHHHLADARAGSNTQSRRRASPGRYRHSTGLTGFDHVFVTRLQFALPLRASDKIIVHFQLEADFRRFLEGK